MSADHIVCCNSNRAVCGADVSRSHWVDSDRGRGEERECRPHVRVDPQQRFGQPAVKNVTAEILAERVHAGESPDEVASDWPGMTRADVLVACWLVACWLVASPTPSWSRYRRAWKDWLTLGQAAALLARGEYDRVMDPPDRDELAAGDIVYGPLDVAQEVGTK